MLGVSYTNNGLLIFIPATHHGYRRFVYIATTTIRALTLPVDCWMDTAFDEDGH